MRGWPDRRNDSEPHAADRRGRGLEVLGGSTVSGPRPVQSIRRKEPWSVQPTPRLHSILSLRYPRGWTVTRIEELEASPVDQNGQVAVGCLVLSLNGSS